MKSTVNNSERNEFLASLQSRFKNLKLRKGEEFGEQMKGDIWLCGTSSKTPIFNCSSSMKYRPSNKYINGLNKDIVIFLAVKGWSHQMLDSETCQIYKVV